MLFQDKTKIFNEGKEFLCLVSKGANHLQFLHAYNLWYSKALEFVTIHAKCRLKEFEERHAENQAMLCDPSRKDFQPLKMNLIIQMTIIEASEDHSPHLV